MKSAAQIMKKKAQLKEELDRALPKEQSEALWLLATQELEKILERYRSLPKGLHTHTDSFIFPSAAVYLTAKEALGEKAAYALVENAAIAATVPLGKKLARLMKVPGMKSLFVKAWDPLTKRMFGEACGFQNAFYPKKKGEYRMDILACPYCRFFTELGCPELTKIYCDNDERSYGNLPGLSFLRTTTLGKGGKRCDFHIRIDPR